MRTLFLPYTDVFFSQMRICHFPNADVQFTICGRGHSPNADVPHVGADVLYIRTVYSEGPHLVRSAYGNHRCDAVIMAARMLYVMAARM